jgi:hypothetical protein
MPLTGRWGAESQLEIPASNRWELTLSQSVEYQEQRSSNFGNETIQMLLFDGG